MATARKRLTAAERTRRDAALVVARRLARIRLILGDDEALLSYQGLADALNCSRSRVAQMCKAWRWAPPSQVLGAAIDRVEARTKRMAERSGWDWLDLDEVDLPDSLWRPS